MEKTLNIKIKNKHTIYGTFNEIKDSQGLIVFVHGLTGNQDENIFVNGAKYFETKGYSSYRFNLYGEQKDARKLKTTNLKDHIDDVNAVTQCFIQKGIQNIILIGHSFGGLTILYSQIQNVTSLILRDPSIGGKELLSDVHYNNKTKSYVIDRGDGGEHPIGPRMYKDFLIDPIQHTTQIHKIKLPIKIICADKGLKKNGEKYYKFANTPKDLTIIPGATHCFFEKGTDTKLFSETYKRIKKYSKI